MTTIKTLVNDTDLDALFHARIVALCKAGLPQMALVTREKPKQAQSK
jgi:hypothetical protein